MLYFSVAMTHIIIDTYDYAYHHGNRLAYVVGVLEVVAVLHAYRI